MHLKLISCDIFQREVEVAIARSHNHVEIEYLSCPLHQLSPSETVRYLQPLVDRATHSDYHAVLLLVGACKYGLDGLETGVRPLVLPRARDCISLILERGPYPRRAAFASSVRTPCRHGRPGKPTLCLGTEATFWVAPAYGAVQKGTVRRWPSPRTGLGSVSQRFPSHFPSQPSQSASEAKPYRSVLEMLVEGYWNYSDFLVVPPGWRVVVNDAEGTIAAEEQL